MKRKILICIAAILCIAGAFILVIIGVKAASHPAVIPGLTCLGELTLEAYDARPDESGEEGAYTIYYRYIDPKYGEIIFANSVGDEDYYSYQYDQMRADDAMAGYIPAENNDAAKRSQIRRYVYVYPVDGRYEAVFQDKYIGLTDVTDLIDPTPKVSSTYYYIASGVLLMAGVYLLFLAFTGKREENEQ